ncbi:hypothetical protein HBH70_019660 [Parastagonospora nodorum]|nr:hypothetical protein HBI10_004600 [Parastagonospora nodorum]KAH4023313.1 hypothetical protein HBI13_086310 [Parastagonospora nodorum]KAH4069096.1 hypothetical protein HBH50_108680 [Parastagonospora nodorum]KAH4088165.1 hypothetical protein HBH48_125650 [Parastagonospora nodorum]KAH4271122.1 hypothetical protein HBI03_036010 [Parastagonospora nodorum]
MSLYTFAAVLLAATSAHCTWVVCTVNETVDGASEMVESALLNSYLEVAVLLLCLTLAVWYAAGLKDQVKHLKGHVQHLHGKVKEDDKGEKKAQ